MGWQQRWHRRAKASCPDTHSMVSSEAQITANFIISVPQIAATIFHEPASEARMPQNLTSPD
jgi:hypothetical protein